MGEGSCKSLASEAESRLVDKDAITEAESGTENCVTGTRKAGRKIVQRRPESEEVLASLRQREEKG